MLGLLKKLFGGKTEEVKPAQEAPYKVEAPSTSPVAEKAVEAVVASIEPAPKKKGAPRKQGAPKQNGPKKGGRKPKSKPQA